jgi:hypothetical protein
MQYATSFNALHLILAQMGSSPSAAGRCESPRRPSWSCWSGVSRLLGRWSPATSWHAVLEPPACVAWQPPHSRVRGIGTAMTVSTRPAGRRKRRREEA